MEKEKNEQEKASTEEKIFEAAREVFHQKGFDGARMQEIADRAEINKSMLHYYYRSKDKLFEKVYQLALLRALPQIVSLLNKEMPLEDKLRLFVKEYLRVLKQNPDIPSFILRELNTKPSRIQDFFRNQVAKRVQPFIRQVQEASEEGRIIGDLPAEQVMANTMSLLLFPFIGKPILQILFEIDDASFETFIDKRLDYLPDYVVKMTLK
jgi:TetR/AcrR family transcriptional regulator